MEVFDSAGEVGNLETVVEVDFEGLDRLERGSAPLCGPARALELGVNFIDTARHYGRGEAEARVGAALKGVERETVHVATKMATTGSRAASMT